jgi:hypothetical protein
LKKCFERENLNLHLPKKKLIKLSSIIIKKILQKKKVMKH